MNLIKEEAGATSEQMKAGLSDRLRILAKGFDLMGISELPTKVNKEYLESQVRNKRFFMMDHGKTMICEIEMYNGHRFRGESNCVDPANFILEKGYEKSYEEALNKAWVGEGYLLQWLRQVGYSVEFNKNVPA